MDDKRYTKEHEWIKLEENIATIGITDHAQESLGDIVFIELPKVGTVVNAGQEVSVVESVKAASDIYSPIDGEIIEVNTKLKDEFALLNQDAENEGWIFKVKISNLDQLKVLLSLDEYKKFLIQN
tara:strand:- start:2906 stop:3280 length:375 start_codon:yes stop_codon:yes gene_type:complete